MSTTPAMIRAWLEEGKKMRPPPTHLLVVCDTFDHEDYSVYAHSKEEAIRKSEGPGEMQRTMEVYCYAGDLEAQLRAGRSFTFDAPAPVPAQPAPHIGLWDLVWGDQVMQRDYADGGCCVATDTGTWRVVREDGTLYAEGSAKKPEDVGILPARNAADAAIARMLRGEPPP